MGLRFFYLALLAGLSKAADEVCDANVAQRSCFDVTCGVKIEDASADHYCSCTEEHVGYDFTSCADGTRSVYYFWKPPATCHDDKMTLPAPITGIACNVTCAQGEHLNVVEDPVKCEQCEKGTYSLAGGLTFDPPWVVLPPQFTTECTGAKACNPWRVVGQYLDSGDNYENHGTDNSLALQVELIKAGRVAFEYRYDGEPKYDIFKFFDNGLLIFEKKNPSYIWNSVNFTLQPGFHDLQWVFHKDPTLSVGADKAAVRSIQVLGVRLNDLQCLLCPPGRFNDAIGQTSCKACAADSSSQSYGATECKKCNPWETSFPGSAECLPSLPCTKYDIRVRNGECENGKRNVSYDWIQPSLCQHKDPQQGKVAEVGQSLSSKKITHIMFDQPFVQLPVIQPIEVVIEYAYGDQFIFTVSNVTLEGFQLETLRINTTDQGWDQRLKVNWVAKSEGAGTQLPRNKTSECVQKVCPPGTETGGDHSCSYCPAGKSGAGGDSRCVKCGDGEGAADFLTHITDWSSVMYNTGCDGECGTKGWRQGGEFLDSGAGHGKGATSYLTLAVPGNPKLQVVEMMYWLSCPEDAGFLELSVDSTVVERVECSGCASDDIVPAKLRVNITAIVPAENAPIKVLSLKYHKTEASDFRHKCDALRVYNITFSTQQLSNSASEGVSAGASTCQLCPPGTFIGSDSHICEECPVGNFSSVAGSPKCLSCPDGEMSYKPGQQSCVVCGASTDVKEDQSGCVSECEPAVESGRYQLRRGGNITGPVVVQSMVAAFSYQLLEPGDFCSPETVIPDLYVCVEAAKTLGLDPLLSFNDFSIYAPNGCAWNARQRALVRTINGQEDYNGPANNDFAAICYAPGTLRYYMSQTCDTISEYDDVPPGCFHTHESNWTKEVPGSEYPSNASPMPLFVCVQQGQRGERRQTGIVANGGIVASYTKLDADRNTLTAIKAKKEQAVPLGITTTFRQGSEILCAQSDGSSTVQALVTRVHHICDNVFRTDAKDATLLPLKTLDPPCVADLEWFDIQACPMCTKDNYKPRTSLCTNLIQTVTYDWIAPKYCNGGVELPGAAINSCSPIVEVDTAKSVVVSKTMVRVLVIMAFVIVGVLVGVFVFIRKQRRKLYEENMRLRSYAQLAGEGPVPDVVQLHA